MMAKPHDGKDRVFPRFLAVNVPITADAMFTFATVKGETVTTLLLFAPELPDSLMVTMDREIAEELAHAIYVALEENPL